MRAIFTLFNVLAIHVLLAQSIAQIQGDGDVSPYNGQVVNTSGIVTKVDDNGWFMQSLDSDIDNNVNTSEGIFVYTGTPPTLSAGQFVEVTASVQEYEQLTELYSVTAINVVDFFDALPAPIILNSDNVSDTAWPIPDLEKYEGMRVVFDGIVCGPSQGYNAVPFYVSAERPMREAGIAAPAPSNLLEWDNNPELLWLRPHDGGGYNTFNGGMSLAGEAVLTQDGSHYNVLPYHYTIAGEPKLHAVREKEENEVTIASVNALWMIDGEDNYNTHVKKVAKYIAHSLHSPDIIALQEIGGYSELEDLSFYIRQEDPSADYDIYFLPGTWELNTGYLVQSGVLNYVEISQPSKDEFFDYSPGQKLHDRPPLLLTGNLVSGHYIQLLNLHVRSLNGITGSNAAYVRNKRHEQAISIANTVESLNENSLIVLGDFNAFAHSDGYVDVTNQIAGTPSLGALYEVEEVVSTPLVNLTNTLPIASERYSYVYQGNANLLDNCLANDLDQIDIVDLEFARGNADNFYSYENDLSNVLRSSDHDGFVLYLAPLGTVATTDVAPSSDIIISPNPANELIQIESSTSIHSLIIYNALGQEVSRQQGASSSWQINITEWEAGIYYVHLQANDRRHIGRVVVE